MRLAWFLLGASTAAIAVTTVAGLILIQRWFNAINDELDRADEPPARNLRAVGEAPTPGVPRSLQHPTMLGPGRPNLTVAPNPNHRRPR